MSDLAADDLQLVAATDERCQWLRDGPPAIERRSARNRVGRGARCCRGAARGRCASERGRCVECRVLGEDRQFEVAQLAAGVHAEVVAQSVAQIGVCTQGVRLAAAAVQDHHEQSPQRLTQCLCPTHILQFGCHLAVTPASRRRPQDVLRGRPVVTRRDEPRRLAGDHSLPRRCQRRATGPMRSRTALPPIRIGLRRGGLVHSRRERRIRRRRPRPDRMTSRIPPTSSR